MRTTSGQNSAYGFCQDLLCQHDVWFFLDEFDSLITRRYVGYGSRVAQVKTRSRAGKYIGLGFWVAYLGKAHVPIQLLIQHSDLLHAHKVVVLREDKGRHDADESSHSQRHNVASQHGEVLEGGVICDLPIADLQNNA